MQALNKKNDYLCAELEITHIYIYEVQSLYPPIRIT